MAGIALTHVPYKVIGQATTDLLSGQVSLWFPTIPGALPHIRAGKMIALAVAGGKRSPALAEVPTVAESGLSGFEASTWYPLLVPAGTPQTIVGKLSRRWWRSSAAPRFTDASWDKASSPLGRHPRNSRATSRANSRNGRKW